METKIVRLDDTGRGISYCNGKITFVPKTVVGDIIDVKITKEKKHYNEGKIVDILHKSPNRVEPPCPYFSICGGCDLQNISYEDSLRYKKEKVINIFKNIDIDIDPEVISNPHPYNYRNKITLKIENGHIGFYEAKTHKIIKVANCQISSKAINNIIPLIKDFNIINGEITIRSNQNDEILLVINTSDEINIDIEKLKSVAKLCGIVLNDKTYYGEPFLYEVINNIVFRISYDSFFQVNPYVASLLFSKVSEHIQPSDQVLDLYCGVGTLSLTAAKKASTAIGIEIVPNAVLNAITNARINKIENAKFILNDATEAVKKIKIPFNKLIVDPPRSGLTKEVIKMILKQKPEEIIYISCDVQTLKRDIELLKEAYDIAKTYIFDMFSYTYHVECCTLLSLKEKQKFK